MTDKLHSDVAEIKKFLIGTEFDKKNCVSYRFDQMETKVCIMENQLNTLMQDREKNKGKVTITVPKWLSALVGLKVKTGI